MSAYSIESLPESSAVLGEGPHWDIATQSLYYVDSTAGVLLRYDYRKNKVYRTKIEGESLSSFVIPVDGAANKFLVGCGRRVVVVAWDGTSETAKVEKVLFEVQQNDKKFENNRFNDGKCDPRGRLFTGTLTWGENIEDFLEHRSAELYKYVKGGKVEVMKNDVCLSNGLTWNEKTKKFYYIDSADDEVKEYDYDIEQGVISNLRIAFKLHQTSKTERCLLDGMTIDIDGNIYVAVFRGSKVYKINPMTGKILLEIDLPVKQVTSVAFGGPNLDILYVTSASLFNAAAPGGTTYKITGLGVQGLPMTKAQI